MKPTNEDSMFISAKLIFQNLRILFILCLITLNSGFVIGQYDPLTNITDNAFAQYNPAIDGDYVVYESWRGGSGSDIYLYDIVSGTETKITSGTPGMSSHPDISGDRIVWQDNRNGGWEIYTYLISRPDIGDYLLLDLPGEQVSPAIYENILVYSDHQDAEFATSNIFMYDIATAELTQITDDEDLSQHKPDIYGFNIVYEDTRNGNLDIYLYNINTQEETQLTEDPADQLNPSIHGRRVVWEDKRDGNWNLYMHYINDPLEVYENYDWPIYTGENFREISESNDKNPAVYEDYIVFQSYRNGSWDIYLYSFINDTFGSTSTIITEAKDQINPAIYDNRIVWQDERDWNGTAAYEADIWLWERPPGADLGVIISDYPDTVVTGNTLLYTIIVKNFGNQEATNVVYTQTLPEEVDFVHASSSGGHTFSLVNNTLTCNIASIQVGETDSINVLVKTVEDAIITTSCELTATEEDPIPENNSISATTVVRWVFPDEVGDGQSPKIITDNQGDVHILYTGFHGAGQGPLIYANNATGKWVRDYELTTSNDIKYKSIDIDSENHVHIVYGTGAFRDKSIMYINNVSGDWSSPVLIKEHTEDCASLTLHLDSEDKMHIAYMKSSSAWDSLFYMNNTTDDWETELISDLTYSKSSFELDNNDRAHFVYISSNEYGDPNSFKPTYITNSPEGSWSSPEYVEENYYGGAGEKFIFDMDVDNEGVPHVIYVGSIDQTENGLEVLKYANRLGGIWQNEILDNRDFSFGFVAITTDVNNKPNLVYSNYLDWPLMELIYSSRTDDSWETHLLEPGDNPIFDLDICADLFGNIHVACEDTQGELIFINYYFINGSVSYPEVFAIPDQITFDPQTEGTASQSQRIVIQNRGGKLLKIYDIYLSEIDASHFEISGSNCKYLNTMATCIVDVVFNPQTVGYKYAKLRIISNDPDQPDLRVPLEGIGEVATHISSLAENSIIVYPNPARDFIVFQFNGIIPEDEYLMKIISLNGEIIKEKMIHIDNNKQSYQIHINNLPCGIYIVSLSGENVFYHFKFIKAR